MRTFASVPIILAFFVSCMIPLNVSGAPVDDICWTLSGRATPRKSRNSSQKGPM